jgi:hypothetical protein
LNDAFGISYFPNPPAKPHNNISRHASSVSLMIAQTYD